MVKTAKSSILLMAILALLLASATPALAALAQNAPNPADYALQDDGTVIIGGDVAMSCGSFASYLNNDSYNHPGSVQQARNVLQQCRERGSLEASDSTQLPDTGGPPLLLITGALLAGTGLVAYRRTRWQ